MLYEQAIIAFALNLMSLTHSYDYDNLLLENVAKAVAETTQDLSEAETLIKIARYESGGFRMDVAACKIKGDNGAAHGLFQVHPRNKQEAIDLCSSDYRKQAKVALNRVRESAEMCNKFGMKKSDLLTGYTVGKCTKNDKSAKARYGDGSELKKLMLE